MLRIALRSERQKYKPQEVDLFLRLETHAREIHDQSPRQWESIALSSKAVRAYSGTGVEKEMVSSFFAKVRSVLFSCCCFGIWLIILSWI